MSTREIKNAVNNTTGELIYFKGHAKATFMSDGSTVEDVINNIESKIDLSDYVKSEELEEYAKIEDIPSLEGYAKEEDIPNLDGYATQQWVNEQEFANQGDLLNMSFNDIQDSPITENNDGEVNIVDENGNVALKVNNEGLYVKDVIAGEHILSNKMNHSEFKTINGNSILGEGDIVISGGEGGSVNWEDIQNKPTIPSAVTESTVSGWGFTKNVGTVTGARFNDVEEIDLDPNGKLRLYGVTDVIMNGNSKTDPKGVVNLGTVITSHQDISGKQDKLVSGTNIKTINGQSILGSGNVTIEGGTGNSDANVQAVDEISTIIDVDLDKYIVETTDDNITLDNNKYYKKTNVSSSISITLNIPEDNTVFTSFSIEFTTGETGTSVSLPDSIKWLNGELPIFENNFTYQISICNGLGVCAKYA